MNSQQFNSQSIVVSFEYVDFWSKNLALQDPDSLLDKILQKVDIHYYRYHCPICPKDKNELSQLRLHMKSAHLGLKKKCNECNKVFSLSSYRNHMQVSWVIEFLLWRSKWNTQTFNHVRAGITVEHGRKIKKFILLLQHFSEQTQANRLFLMDKYASKHV